MEQCRCDPTTVTCGCVCSDSAGVMLSYRRESPAMPRCPVRGGRVVHGTPFAYCPSPQGRSPSPPPHHPPLHAELSSASPHQEGSMPSTSRGQGHNARWVRLYPALHRLPGAHACPFAVGAVSCPDHGFLCPGSPGRLVESRERYELDALPWQGPRLGLEELQKPGEVLKHCTKQGGQRVWKMLSAPWCCRQSRRRWRGPTDMAGHADTCPACNTLSCLAQSWAAG